jgi:hypothetical protein
VTQVHLGTAISDTPKNSVLDYSAPSTMSFMSNIEVPSCLKEQMKCDQTVFIHSFIPVSPGGCFVEFQAAA